MFFTLLIYMSNFVLIGYYLLYHILYIIAEAERKWAPTIKDVLTNKKKDPLKYCHVHRF